MGGFIGQSGGIGRGGFFGASPVSPSNNWVECTPPLGQQINGVFFGCGYGAGKYLVVETEGGGGGTDSAVHVSTDLVNWSTVLLPNVGQVDACQVAYGAGKYVIIGGSQNALFNSVAFYSTDGITWHTSIVPIPEQGGPWLINYGSGVFLVVNSQGQSYATSPDGIVWTLQGAYTPPQGIWDGLQLWHDGTRFITGTFDAGGDGILAYSADGINWTQTAALLPTFAGVNPSGIASSPTQYVTGPRAFFTTVGVRGPNLATLATPVDIWLGETQDAQMVAYGGGRFVCVGENSDAVPAVSSTDDGVTWSFETPPAGYPRPNNNQVVFGGGHFLSVGFNPNYAMQRTP